MRRPRSTGYRVRLTAGEKAELERLADRAGVTVADALREGGLAWLHARQPYPLPRPEGPSPMTRQS